MATLKKQTISFTALPNGVAPSGKLRLSVYVSPRLWTDDPPTTDVNLSEFPDWVDWPSTALTFTASFGGGSAAAATRVGAAARSDLWTALFGPATTLRPRTFDGAVADAMIQSYKVKEVHAQIRDIYTYFAANFPTEFPTVADLLDDDGPLRDIVTPFIPLPPPGPIIKSILRATTPAYDTLKSVENFHKPFKTTKAPINVPDVDFHQMLSALGRYPVLMRMLGIVHDLEVDHPGSLGATTVEVIATWPTAPAMPHLKTRCFVSTLSFYATPRASDPDLSSDGLGMLKFNDATAYDLVQVNQDGAAIRTLRFAESLVRATFDESDPLYGLGVGSGAKKYKTDDTPTSYSLPSMQTAGLAVARADHDTKLKAHMQKAKTNNTALEALGDVMLDAEDLTRGYAIDVYDGQSALWRSLNERVGKYKFSNTTLTGTADEGWISAGLTSVADKSSNDSKLPETLFNWFGWSLSAPRPGKAMDENGQPAAVQNAPATQFDLQADFVAKPGSLPKLRFGTSYRLRARAVDLAGNRTARDSVTSLANATNEVIYGRFEPVASPEVVLDDALDEGESSARLVIRSNFDEKVDEAGIWHIAPPKAAEPMIETLGLFDASDGSVDSKAYNVIRKLDGGSWRDIGKDDPNNPGVFFVKGEGRKLPYMPDLLSRGAVLRGLPGASAAVRVGFGYDEKSWPDAQPFDLVLREGAAAPSFSAGPRRLNVQLGKADVATVRLSSYLDPLQGDVDRMALLRWMQQEEPSSVNTFRQQVADGVHWMVTPFRTLTLVHAVRQPLLRPKYVGLTFARALGQTFAGLSDPTMELSRKSTVRLDIVAKWTEMIDAISESGPMQINGDARPFQFNVPLAPTPAQETVLAVSGKHEFHDTKYRKISYSAHATSRFAEYFAERKKKVDLHSGHPVLLHSPVTDDGVNWGGVVAGSETVTAFDRTTRYARGVDYTMDYASGKLTPLASLDDKDVNITFIAPPIVRQTAEPVVLDIPSSARPAAPKVLYIVPTFGWTSTAAKNDTSYTSERKGGGLRLYLERPWFSSGDGELLGVVIWSGGTLPTDTEKPFVSDWGLDPMYKSAPTTAAPTVGAFKLAAASKTSGLSLAELPGVTTLHVAGHSVGYDNERQLWYCDFEIDAGASYMPFVRLALARYQPNSVPNAHLSRVVLADFVQLTANRSASLTRTGNKPDTLNVAVSGLSYQTLQNAAGPSTVEVSVEERRDSNAASVADDLQWDQVAGSTTALVPAAGPSGTTLWTGQITLPKAPPGRLRVIIREFERFGPTAPDRRLVYADAIVV